MCNFSKVLRRKMDAHDPPMQSVHLAAAMADRGHPVAVVTIDRWLAGTMPSGAALLVVARIFDLKLAELTAAKITP